MSTTPQANGTGELGTVYLLHFARPIGDTTSPVGWAQHYTGWYASPARISHHENGTSGVPIVAEFFRQGISFVVARTRPGTRADERRIKSMGGATRFCPVCSPRPWNGAWGAYLSS